MSIWLRGISLLSVTTLSFVVVSSCAKSSGTGGGSSVGGVGGSGAAGAGATDGSAATGGTGGTLPDATPDVGGGDGSTDTGVTNFDAAWDAGEAGLEASTCTAVSGVQCGTAIACAPGDRCHALYTGTGIRDWPIDSDATGPVGDAGAHTCTQSNGNHWPSVGVGSATWFGFIDCGSYKTFPVSAGCSFDILTYQDCCSGCYLNDINVAVQEKVNGLWTTQETITHPYTPGVCGHFDDIYVPKTNEVRLLYQGSDGFYTCVFQQ